MEDYSITWGYIVAEMEKKYGIPPNSTERFPFGEIEVYMEKIWKDYFYSLDDYYKRLKEKNEND